ncbi:hypothetical protein MZK49_10515 [Ensifer sesbaniae]|uniref:hypothetical protein n=1 Tax=Ensifer sesbaniae TaxID=1214071 RepID=UPI0020011E5D|nr:hypothetical protein [Ensifer sesbaniae]
MADGTLVSVDATDKAMIVSLFIGLPPFSLLDPNYTSEMAPKHCVGMLRPVVVGGSQSHSNYFICCN